MKTEDRSLDILGVKPVANAIETLTKGSVDGAAAFLSRICLPAAEEFGLLLRDRVGAWRARNAAAIANGAKRLLEVAPVNEALHSHPRIVSGVIELGSWTEAEEVQQMWSGLLASSCTSDGRDDSNLMFMDILAKLSLSQARLFDHACRTAEKVIAPAGWLVASELAMPVEELSGVTALTDLHRMDLELDHLRALGILNEHSGGFNTHSRNADVTPTSLALQMFARCQGYRGDPMKFYGLSETPEPVQTQ